MNATEPKSELKRFEFEAIRMGVPWGITLYATSEEYANNASKNAFDRIREMDRMMSDYDPRSELSKLCETSSPGNPVVVSEELFLVLMTAQKLSKETDGAFDVTVGPIVKLWRRARRKKVFPDNDRLKDAMSKAGYQKIVLDECKKSVELQTAGMRIDLGGIAKGYAADEAGRVLRRLGVSQYIIDGGGDLLVGDPLPNKKHWVIAVEGPDVNLANDSKASKLKETNRVLIANAAIATSGDTYKFFEIDGKRYSHLVNPKTGLGLTTRSQVTVIAPTDMEADALASALSVLGPEKGLALIRDKKNVAAQITVVLPDSEELKTYTTKNFNQFLAE